jgi:hypothetical protein
MIDSKIKKRLSRKLRKQNELYNKGRKRGMTPSDVNNGQNSKKLKKLS